MFFHNNYPISNKDFQWVATCSNCDSMTLHVSRKNLQHCYSCGKEIKLIGISPIEINRMRVSSSVHWEKYPKLPYNYYKLNEEQRWKVL